MGLNDDRADRFDVSGPTHMMSKTAAGSSPTMIEIDWDNDEHRRCFAACMVKGTYVMAKENDLTKRRPYTRALAPAWWESFHFRRYDVLKDEPHKNKFISAADQLIFGADQLTFAGAIFRNEPPPGARRHPSAPHYVVAFRGTMRTACFHDMYLNFKILFNKQHECGRFIQARELVENLLDTIANGSATGSCAVWLAGHSLGASIALDVGRYMMDSKRRNLPTFLFNPPQVSPAPVINALHPTEVAKRDLYATSYFVKAGMGLVLPRHHRERMELFERLSPWAPELYVHEGDVICQGFIDYFEQRQQVEERFRGVAESAMTLSYRDMLFSVLSKEKERPHLLPSATLWKNSSVDGDAHGLQQWWKSDGELKLSTRRYSWPGA